MTTRAWLHVQLNLKLSLVVAESYTVLPSQSFAESYNRFRKRLVALKATFKKLRKAFLSSSKVAFKREAQ